MIEPTVGRIVWYHPTQSDRLTMNIYEGAVLSAIVTHVWSSRMVNLTVFDSTGQPHGRTSVALRQDEDTVAEGVQYCEWMPYQKGQAAKTEAAEKAAASAT